MRRVAVPLDQLRQFHRLVTDDMVGAADDHLRRIDRAVARRPGIAALALGVGGFGETVLPADVIPIVDMQRQRDDVIHARQLCQQFIGGRA